MKFATYTFLIGGGLCAASNVSVNFDEWCEKFNVKFSTVSERDHAHRNWLDNYKIVEEINNSKLSWRASMTKYAAMSTAEFQSKILLRRQQIPHFEATHPTPRNVTSPTSWDWRTDGGGAVTSVKDQGTVGTCWAFSTVGNIEGQWHLAGNDLIDLSPEYLVDCDGTHDDKHADCGVFGGWPYLAYQYVISSGGIPDEVSYPYCSGTGDCYPCMQGPISLCGPPPYYCDESIEEQCPNAPRTATISNYATISTDENIIQDTLVSTGPLSVLLDATQLQFYESGIWDGHIPSLRLGCSTTYLDHAVLLVGYGVEDSTEYWTVKNSWGENWGEEGYFRITKGQGTCGINTAVTTAIV